MGPGSVALAHVVTESCIRCKYTDCVATCPVDCFREGENMLVIDPGECIDCQACVPACPAQAIYADGDVPADQAAFIDINARLAKQWPSIRAQKPPPPDADAWKNTPGKRKFLS